MHTTFARLSLLSLLCATATAQSFSYPDFSNTSTINFLGDGQQVGNVVELTNNVGLIQTGWAWHTTAMPVINGFDTTFTFRITPPANGLGEGMALVIHDDPAGVNAMGGQIWGMGYGIGSNNSSGIANSIAIELDTYWDSPTLAGDTSDNEVTIHTRGSQGNHEHENWSIGRNTPAQSFSDAQVHTLRVVYVPGTIEVFFDNGASPIISVPYDLVTGGTYLTGNPVGGANMLNGTAFVGFCATTGAAATLTEQVEILSWEWESEPLTDPCYEGTVGADILRIDGSAGDVRREVELATYQPFTIDISNPPGFGPGAPYILFASFAPQPGAPGTALGFGNACFPMLPFTANELVLFDTFGFTGSLLPSSPTPATIPLPGVVTFPVEFTMQAVTLASGAPLTLGLSNAVDLNFVTSAAPVINSITPLSAVAGQTVTVAGANFVPGLVVNVGGSFVTPLSVSPNEVTFSYPAGLSCDSALYIVNPDSQGVQDTLNPDPVVSGTVLSSGSAAGGNFFVIQGSGFAPGTTVTIGGAPANVINASGAVVTVTTPPGTPGQAQVVLTTPGGCSTTTTYTYL